MNDRELLGLAEAQLLELVDAMGLTPVEWGQLQNCYAMSYLNNDDRTAITQHLQNEMAD